MAKGKKLTLAEKIARVKEGDERQKKGLSRTLNKAKKQIAVMKRREEKDREIVVRETMKRRNEILADVTNYGRIQENAATRERALTECREVFEVDTVTTLTLLDIDKFAVLIRAAVADKDIDNLIDSEEYLEAYNEAEAAYVLDAIEQTGELDEAKIAALWNHNISERTNDVLMRGTTALFSVNMHISQVQGLVSKGECEDWQAEITRRLSKLFAKYHIDVTVGDLADIFAVL